VETQQVARVAER